MATLKLNWSFEKSLYDNSSKNCTKQKINPFVILSHLLALNYVSVTHNWVRVIVEFVIDTNTQSFKDVASVTDWSNKSSNCYIITGFVCITPSKLNRTECPWLNIECFSEAVMQNCCSVLSFEQGSIDKRKITALHLSFFSLHLSALFCGLTWPNISVSTKSSSYWSRPRWLITLSLYSQQYWTFFLVFRPTINPNWWK